MSEIVILNKNLFIGAVIISILLTIIAFINLAFILFVVIVLVLFFAIKYTLSEIYGIELIEVREEEIEEELRRY